MIKEQYKYSALTAKIIHCAMNVHKELGNGFQEVIYQRSLAMELHEHGIAHIRVIYQRSLAMELHEHGIAHIREFEIPVMYKGLQVGTRRVDFLVEGVISTELKAVMKLENAHYTQAINYLEAYNIEIGLLINFGETSLVFKRLTNKKYKPEKAL